MEIDPWIVGGIVTVLVIIGMCLYASPKGLMILVPKSPRHQPQKMRQLVKENVVPTHQKFPTTCFDCEREMIRQELPTYLSHPTRCFSCEEEAVRKGYDPHFEQPNKCFQCENM